MTDPQVTVVGGGLAGCEVSLQLARRGVRVRLLEMKPTRRTPAQHLDGLAELVCSNSFRSNNPGNAVGLLKWEMAHAGSAIMAAAKATAVPAGDALAVDREAFSAALTETIDAAPLIERVSEVVTAIPEGLTVVCTGPLTDTALAADIAARAGQESLYFYDAIAPIIDAESIDWDVVWRQSRYDKGEGADYANVPLSTEEYHAFIAAVRAGEKVVPREFEKPRYFEGCLPIEVMAERGVETLAHGPLKPVGLTDPRTGQRPHAVVQLRMENREATAWNMVGFQTRLKQPEQRRIFRALPGLERAEFLRHGSVHRNTYLDAPRLLTDELCWHDAPDLYFAGQITGVEGYVESTACGLLVAWHVLARLGGHAAPIPPETTALGAIRRHLRGEGIYGSYSPSNINWSFFPSIGPPPVSEDQEQPKGRRRRRESKRDKRARMSARAQADFAAWWAEAGL